MNVVALISAMDLVRRGIAARVEILQYLLPSTDLDEDRRR